MCAVTVVSSVIVVSVVTPPVLLPILALALVYSRIQRRYVATSRELKRCGDSRTLDNLTTAKSIQPDTTQSGPVSEHGDCVDCLS